MVSSVTLRSSYDELDISVIVVSPEDKPKAILQFVHGMCGCKERFLPVMEYMAGNGVICVAGDLRGHGASVKSKEDLGYMYDGGYRAILDDLRMITEWTRSKYPDIPVFLLGHSMGSMAARLYVKKDDSDIDGLVLCGSPSWNPMSYLGKAMSAILCMTGFSRTRMTVVQTLTSGRYNRKFSREGALAWTCSDPESRKSMRENPLCNFHFTANGSYNLLSMMIETYSGGHWTVSNPGLPILFISGSDDPTMVSEKKFHQAAQNMCDRGYRNVTSVIYPDMRHEVLNEIGKEEVWNEILSFVSGA